MKHYFNVIKEIKVTNSFLSLDKDIRGCQEESNDECTTRKYMNTLMNKCQCLPFHLRLSNKVILILKYLKTWTFLYAYQSPLCTAEDLDCVSRIKDDKEDNSECLQQCSGMLVTSYADNQFSNVVQEMIEYMSRKNSDFENMAKEFQGSFITFFVLFIHYFSL